MAYNLPPAWDAGYVLPENVVDEGLERQAFVTKQMPRGSYDNPSVGTGGYQVPQYVLDEGYGQGTYTTKWQPSGTYNGPGIPHWLNQRPQVVRERRLPGGGRSVTVQPLGDVPMPEPFERYGQQAAAGLIARVAPLPPGQRQAVLKKILDAVDKTAWRRTQDIWNRYRKQGMDPAQAFPLALARALSTGITAEIINTGLRGSAPQADSLLGLGCYGCAAVLGAMGDAEPACTSMPGFTWVYGATVNGTFVPGHWERLRAGQTPVPFCPGGPPSGAPTVVTTGTPIVRDQRPSYDFFVGPFGFNADKLKRAWTIGTPSSTVSNRAAPPDILYRSPDTLSGIAANIPAGSPLRVILPEILLWLKARLTEAKDLNGKTDTPVHYTGDSPMYGFPESDASQWFKAMGIEEETPLRMHVLASLRTAGAPLLRTKNPKTGEDMVLHVQLAHENPLIDWDAQKNPLALKVWLSRVPDKSVWGALWNPMIFINPLTATEALASVFSGAAGYLSDLACGVLKDPQGNAAASAGAGAVAAAYGIPPQAGTTGVAIAADACGKPPPPPPPPVIHHSILPWAILAGGLVAVAAVVRRPKKKKAP